MSVLHLLVLGAVKRRTTTHGYRIYHDLMDWRVETWTVVRPGSIYYAVSQLEAKGYIKATQNHTGQKLGPAKTEYTLTSAGEQEFVASLEQALKGIDLQQLSAAIAFMEFLPRQRVIALLGERIKAQRRIPQFLKKLPTEATPTTPSKHPELIRIWSDHFTGAAKSAEHLIIKLQSGNYVFKNEEEKHEYHHRNTARR